MLFLAAAGDDVAQSNAAAQAALAAFGAETVPELLLAAETIACSFAAIDTLAQAARADLPTEPRRRLQSTAVALGRRAEAARRRLNPRRRTPASSAAPSSGPAPTAKTTPAPASQHPPAPAPARASQPNPAPTAPPTPTMRPATAQTTLPYGWDAAFADIAREITASLPRLPRNKRADAAIRVASLEAAAQSLAAQSLATQSLATQSLAANPAQPGKIPSQRPV